MGVLDLDNVFEQSTTSHSFVNNISFFIFSNHYFYSYLDNKIILHSFQLCTTMITMYPEIQFSV